MDNGDLLRGLSSPTVQLFGIALTVLILALNAESLSIARPVALLAAVIMLVTIANWVGQAFERAQANRRTHEHR